MMQKVLEFLEDEQRMMAVVIISDGFWLIQANSVFAV